MNTHSNSAAYGVLLLRVSLGAMYLSHAIVLKVMTFGIDGTVQFFQSLGLPGPLAHLTIFAETLGGLMLILGIQTRWVAAALTPILGGALVVHASNGWVFTAPGGGWEYPLYLIILSIAQVLVGDGAYALNPSRRLQRGNWLSPAPAGS